jgi:hypothetical protein
MSSQDLLSARAHPYHVEHEASMFNGENTLFSDFEPFVDFNLFGYGNFFFFFFFSNKINMRTDKQQLVAIKKLFILCHVISIEQIPQRVVSPYP